MKTLADAAPYIAMLPTGFFAYAQISLLVRDWRQYRLVRDALARRAGLGP